MELEKELRTKEVREFVRTLAGLRGEDEMTAFLRDVLTFEELVEAARRWQAARLLARGTSFREIERRTGMSSTTIARINYWIHHGMGGYRLMLKKLGVTVGV